MTAYTANGTKAQKWKLNKAQVTPLKGIKAETLGSTSLAMDGTKTVKLTVSGGYAPSDATGANGKSRVEWTTPNAGAVTADGTGETATVRAKSPGTATITAWDYNSVCSRVEVKVAAPQKSAYEQKVDAFLADARWRNGATWGSGAPSIHQAPSGKFATTVQLGGAERYLHHRHLQDLHLTALPGNHVHRKLHTKPNSAKICRIRL